MPLEVCEFAAVVLGRGIAGGGVADVGDGDLLRVGQLVAALAEPVEMLDVVIGFVGAAGPEAALGRVGIDQQHRVGRLRSRRRGRRNRSPISRAPPDHPSASCSADAETSPARPLRAWLRSLHDRRARPPPPTPVHAARRAGPLASVRNTSVLSMFFGLTFMNLPTSSMPGRFGRVDLLQLAGRRGVEGAGRGRRSRLFPRWRRSCPCRW